MKQLKFIGLYTETNSISEEVTVAGIENTKELQDLHEKVMLQLKQYFKYDVKPDMLLSKESSESTLLWIKNYPKKSAFKNFFPHITLGYGRFENYSFEEEFEISGLAICHLSNHCTCCKILSYIEIKKKQ